jgi:hypothetical protein
MKTFKKDQLTELLESQPNFDVETETSMLKILWEVQKILNMYCPNTEAITQTIKTFEKSLRKFNGLPELKDKETGK